MYDEKIKIVYWESENGVYPINEFINNLEAVHRKRIRNREKLFECLSFAELRRTKFIEKIEGVKYPLWELKYSGGKGFNFRMVCIIEDDTLLGLVMFKGSGSGGQLSKYIETSLHRAQNWQLRKKL